MKKTVFLLAFCLLFSLALAAPAPSITSLSATNVNLDNSQTTTVTVNCNIPAITATVTLKSQQNNLLWTSPNAQCGSSIVFPYNFTEADKSKIFTIEATLNTPTCGTCSARTYLTVTKKTTAIPEIMPFTVFLAALAALAILNRKKQD